MSQKEHDDPTNKYLKPEEAAEYLRVPRRWIKQAIAERRFPVYKAGRLNRFKQSDLDAYLEGRRVPSSDEAA